MNKVKTVLILGSNSVVGRNIATLFSKKGFNIILALRSKDRIINFKNELILKYKNEVFIEEFDILEEKKFEEFINNLPIAPQIIISTIGIMGLTEKLEDQKIKRLVHTNYLNHILFLELASNYLYQKNLESAIIVIGSVAGERGRKKNYIYGSSKSALHNYLSGLRQKYSNSKLNIMTVIPGYIDTEMLSQEIKNKTLKFLICHPLKLADIIYVSYKKKKSIVYTPYWRIISLILKFIPEAIFKKLSF